MQSSFSLTTSGGGAGAETVTETTLNMYFLASHLFSHQCLPSSTMHSAGPKHASTKPQPFKPAWLTGEISARDFVHHW